MKKILVAVDGSPREADVIRAAADLAAARGAELVLFRAVGIPLELPPDALSMSPPNVAALLQDLARQALERRAAELPKGTRVRVAPSTPWHGIVDAAAAEHADLIVIGSHGYGGIDRLLGTTAAKVVNHAPCSVLVVKP